VILLHGFPMNSTVWDSFADELSKDFKVLTPDLPGFGGSQLLEAPFSLDEVGQKLYSWILENHLENCVLIGHSLGGYVALAMVERNPDCYSGLGLFHSTAYADSPDRKQSRTKVLDFIDNNGVLAFTSNFIPPLFFNARHPDIDKVRAMAVQSTTETVKGYTIAMRERPDRTAVLEKFSKPVLFLCGEKDGGIAPETIFQQASKTQKPEVHILEKTAHMGMFENFVGTTNIVRAFARKCFA
jgi:pimeloyl-ACP methyl ester carboxylesterase